MAVIGFLLLVFVPHIAFAALSPGELAFIEALILAILQIIPFLFAAVLLLILWEAVQAVLLFSTDRNNGLKALKQVLWGVLTLCIIIASWWLINYLHGSF